MLCLRFSLFTSPGDNLLFLFAGLGLLPLLFGSGTSSLGVHDCIPPSERAGVIP